MAPVVLCTAHNAEVNNIRFSEDGKTFAAASSDKTVSLWNTFDCNNIGTLNGHRNAVLGLAYYGDTLASCSADQSVIVWDLQSGTINTKHTHASPITCIDATASKVYSGSDDSKVIVWANQKTPVQKIDTQLPVTALQVSLTGSFVYTGSVDNCIKTWDMRNTCEPVLVIECHNDTVISLKLNKNDGAQMLSSSFDNSLKIWNIAPGLSDRCRRAFEVRTIDASAPEFVQIHPTWSPSGTFVACGSVDRNVYVWDVVNGKIKYKLPGHKGTVTAVDWHPTEPIIASCSADSSIYLGEVTVK